MLALAPGNVRRLMLVILTALTPAMALSLCRAAEPLVYAWVEAESPAYTNTEFATERPRQKLLSDGAWIRKSLDKGQAEATVPEEGFLLRYLLQVPENGRYQLWVRVGFEAARAPLEWRLGVGQGQWTKVGSDVLTTNVMELGEWMEVAWLHLSTLDLAAGPTTLEIRYRKPGGDGRMLMALDCIALTKGRFVPEGRLKPGETYHSQADREAANTVFELPAPTSVARTQVKLSGLWQVARYDDPDMDRDAHVPVQAIPSEDEYPLRWMGIQVPLSLWNKQETVFAHRVIYRTRVKVPAAHRGRGFYLHFSGTNWLVSVFVNGQLAGTHRGVWIPWDLDISGHVRPGQVNELAVAVKGPYYAVDVENYGRVKDLDQHRNRPKSRQDWVFWIEPIYPSTKGDGDGVDYGIVNPVTLVSVGNAYTEDVFVKPSVARKRLETDVTVRNTTDQERRLQVLCEAVHDQTNQAEKSFGPVDITVPANDTAMVTVAGEWQDPKLWWPQPNPDLYRLRTTISEAGTPLDVQEELFGFREVTIEGTGILINGVRRNFWNWVNVAGRPFTGEEWLQAFHADRDRFTRFSQNRKTSAFLPTREERLEFYDRNGIPGRLCSMIDGMFISRTLGERTRDPDTGEPVLIVNEPVWEGFRRHLEQLARAYRNHPSVIFYQAENELVYITGMNIYGAYLDRVEELMGECIEAAREIDPTRPYTVGGAGDLSGRLEINDPHYPAGSLDWYPDNAYTLTEYAPKITRWPWKRQKPWVVGESAHANELRYGSYVLGDEVFRGPDYANRGKAKYLRMLYGGYRWAGVAGFFPWDNLHRYEDGQKAFSDLCVIPRKQTHRLYGGQDNELLFKVMNDTFSDAPVTFEWSYEVNGRKIAGERADLRITPGFGQEQTLSINPPAVSKRLDGVLTLKATQAGTDDYLDVRSVPVLPVVKAVRVKAPLTVLDRSGKLEAFLTDVGAKFENIEVLADAKGKSGVLIIGPDTLTPDEAFGQDLLAFAAQGGRVIVLEQEVPVGGANLPAPLKTTTHYGGYAHPKALGTPLFRDLGKEDFIDWAGDHPAYKNVYDKPLQGGRTLVECGDMLRYAPLIEMPCGKGIILLCQLRVGAKLGLDAAASILLRNMIEVYANYRPATGVVAIYSPDNGLLADKVKQTGVLAEAAPSLDEALDSAKYQVAVVHATAGNLAALNGLNRKAQAFQRAGGWIMLCGLERDGLDEFNRLLGTNHLLRPFRMERVTLENPHFHLAATLGNRDLAMYSNQSLAAWKGLYWISRNVYTNVVDGVDIAPFCQMPGGPEDPFVYEPTMDDKDPYNFVNGMLNSDFWRYIQQIWVPEEGAQPLTFTLRRPETIAGVRIWNNANYWTIKDIDVIFDGDDRNAVSAVLPDSAALATIKLPRPRRAEKAITLQIRSWRETRPDRPDVRLVGIDNVQFLRAEAPSGAVFIDNVGGLVAYPRGKGGVFLNQLKFMADEPNQVNADKKLRALGVLLQNMGAGSRTAEVAIPGVNVRYETINLTDYCTQYMREHAGKPGWFGQKGQDLRTFRVGEQTLANVTYHPVDYSTAPVPDCIMLAARGAPQGLPQAVEGIKVGKRADLLFFLQAARVTRPINEDERSRIGAPRRAFALPEVARYVLHYADGKTADIPVILEKHVDHWMQEEPTVLEAALVAWSGQIEGVEDQRAVLYSMQAPNPRPDVVIESIDVVVGRDANGNPTNRAVPALLAITLGTVLR
ncbi:MAG: glycoside hydrolase family 2 TIM barrel-domain containing protein [Armatimonadota bacterium]